MTTLIANVTLRSLLSLGTLAIGVLTFKILPFFEGGMKLFSHIDTVSTIASTFSILLMGFLSTIIVIISGTKDSFFFRKYKQSGSLGTFLYYFFFTIICLLGTHILAIASMSGYLWFKIMLAAMVMNIVQIIFICILTHRISTQ